MFRTLPLSLSLAGLDFAGDPRAGEVAPAEPRSLLHWAAAGPVRAVTLDGAMPGLRARELSRSARRDLGATLRRVELTPAGLDLWIPPPHFVDPARQDRAIEAVLGAMELAADLRALVGSGSALVTIELPTDLDAGVVRTLASAADRAGARLADAACPWREPAPGGTIAPALDPAAAILAGLDPVAEAGRLGATLAGARLSDLSPAGRVEPGSAGGRLDVAAYGAALAAGGYDGFVTLDLRRLREPTAAVERVHDRWAATP